MDYTQIIIIILQSVLVPLITWGLYMLRNWLMLRSKSELLDRALMQATDAAVKAVGQTSQTYVDGVKGTEGWDAAAQAEALRRATETAKTVLGQEGMALLNTVTGDANAYLTAAIESAVRSNKK